MNHLQGDKLLYNQLREGALVDPKLKWKPVHENQVLPTEALHQAIVSGKQIELDGDINEPQGTTGNTSLILSVQSNNLDAFRQLLAKGAKLDLFNYEHRTALHEAVRISGREHFIEPLLAAGANIEASTSEYIDHGKTALDLAIEAKNRPAIEILMQKGSKVKMANSIALEELGIITEPVPTRNAYADVVGWVKGGDCVVLHAPNRSTYCYAQSDKVRRLIYLKVDPALLDEGEWPDFFETNGGLKRASLDLRKSVPLDKNFSFELPSLF